MNLLLNNWKLKLTSLVIAIALWGHVRNEVNPSEDAIFRVQLSAPPPPPNLIILNAKDIPAMVKVNVKALRLTLRELKGVAPSNPLMVSEEAPMLTPSQMRATLDFSLARPGKQPVPIKIETSLENLGDITPKLNDVVLEFAAAASAELEIEPQFSGESLQDYIVDEVTLVPRRARVFGPADAIARVARLRARIAAPRNLAGELSVNATPLEPVDRAGRVLTNVRVDPETVAVSAMLHEKTTRAIVPLALRVEGDAAPGFAVQGSEIAPARIAVNGTRAALAKLKEIPARLSVAGEKAPLRRRVRLELPPGVTLAEKQEIWATAQIVPATPATENATPVATSTATLPPPATP